MNMSTQRVQSGHGDSGSGGAPGSSMPGWLKITGIGCVAVLLVGGLLLGLGVFQTATCCTEYGDLMVRANQVQEESYEFASELHRGDYEAAYSLLSPAVRDEMSREEFRGDIEEYRDQLDASEPFPMAIDYDALEDFDPFDPGAVDSWFLDTQFAEPQFEQLLDLRLNVTTEETEDDDIIDVYISGWEFDITEQDYRDHRFSQRAREFQDNLIERRYSNAQGMTSNTSQLRQLSQEEFTEEMGSTAGRLREMEELEVHAIVPQQYNIAAVRMVMRDGEGSAQLLDYFVDFENRIVGFADFEPAPLLDAPEQVDTDSDESSDDAAEAGESEDDGDIDDSAGDGDEDSE